MLLGGERDRDQQVVDAPVERVVVIDRHLLHRHAVAGRALDASDRTEQKKKGLAISLASLNPSALGRTQARKVSLKLSNLGRLRDERREWSEILGREQCATHPDRFAGALQ
ncbi:hypothetical protein BCO37747_04735 [Burkholderia contaminans]|jgi:hypothetical protein|nr:hypothetical protein BCO37747_04735 [Burkholderia contaminans]